MLKIIADFVPIIIYDSQFSITALNVQCTHAFLNLEEYILTYPCDITTRCSNAVNIEAYTPCSFWDEGALLQCIIDAFYTVRLHGEQETTEIGKIHFFFFKQKNQHNYVRSGQFRNTVHSCYTWVQSCLQILELGQSFDKTSKHGLYSSTD